MSKLTSVTEMNATASLVTLAERSLANYVLGGNLLPLNNNAAFIRESTTATVSIVDKDDRVIACGAIAMYSLNRHIAFLERSTKTSKLIPSGSRRYQAPRRNRAL